METGNKKPSRFKKKKGRYLQKLGEEILDCKYCLALYIVVTSVLGQTKIKMLPRKDIQ